MFGFSLEDPAALTQDCMVARKAPVPNTSIFSRVRRECPVDCFTAVPPCQIMSAQKNSFHCPQRCCAVRTCLPATSGLEVNSDTYVILGSGGMQAQYGACPHRIGPPFLNGGPIKFKLTDAGATSAIRDHREECRLSGSCRPRPLLRQGSCSSPR